MEMASIKLQIRSFCKTRVLHFLAPESSRTRQSLSCQEMNTEEDKSSRNKVQCIYKHGTGATKALAK